MSTEKSQEKWSISNGLLNQFLPQVDESGVDKRGVGGCGAADTDTGRGDV